LKRDKNLKFIKVFYKVEKVHSRAYGPTHTM